MRFLPLLSSRTDPAPWNSFRAAELAWEGSLHAAWESAVRRGMEIHAVHLSNPAWGESLVAEALEVIRTSLGADFLVIPARLPEGRRDQSRILGGLEILLEALQGRGIKIALRPAPGQAAALATLMKEVGCDAVGYCWDAGVGADLEAISDRLFTAVSEGGEELSGLQRLGYRWNVAVPMMNPETAALQIADLQVAHPMVYFPQVQP